MKENKEISEILKPFIINQNTMREIQTHLLEISKRDSLKASDLLRRLVDETSGDSVHRVELLRESLKIMRYPRYQAQLKEFNEKVKSLKLPPHVSLTSAPFFEEDFVELKVQLSNQKDCEDLKVLLDQIQKTFF